MISNEKKAITFTIHYFFFFFAGREWLLIVTIILREFNPHLNLIISFRSALSSCSKLRSGYKKRKIDTVSRVQISAEIVAFALAQVALGMLWTHLLSVG